MLLIVCSPFQIGHTNSLEGMLCTDLLAVAFGTPEAIISSLRRNCNYNPLPFWRGSPIRVFLYKFVNYPDVLEIRLFRVPRNMRQRNLFSFQHCAVSSYMYLTPVPLLMYLGKAALLNVFRVSPGAFKKRLFYGQQVSYPRPIR